MPIQERMKSKGIVWIWISILVMMIDRLSKIWMVNHLVYQEPIKILPVFNFTLAYNTGAAFSFLDHASGWQNIALGGLAFIVSLSIIYWLYKLPANNKIMNIALCLILAGALGNAWDRILYGYVIDFLSFHWGDWYFAIFNIADTAICLGAFLLFCHWFLRGHHA